MRIGRTLFHGRRAWELDNGEVTLTMLEGGGHIAGLRLRDGPRVNPLWIPAWKTIEPWAYRRRHARRYALRLLAAISGHNPCLGWFGDPSPEEARAGMECHGEAPVARWRLIRRIRSAAALSLTCRCTLPVAQMELTRTLRTRKGSNAVQVREVVRNLSRRDLPFTMCQHVTVGPPFLEKGVTVFDMPATRGHTFPGRFGDSQRLCPDQAFTWPHGPGAAGRRVDLRMIGREFRRSSDFTTQLIDPRRRDAWFSAVNPRQGLLLAYVWRREDYPWVGNWEENFGRQSAPWSGRSLARGMEFANTPFPVGLRRAVEKGRFHGLPTFRWLPARSSAEFRYDILLLWVPEKTRGVADIRRGGRGFEVQLKTDR